MTAAEQYRNPTDWFYLWKYDPETGEVREGWSYANLLEWYWAGVPKRGTRGCHTTGRK